MRRREDPSDRTESEWKILEPVIPPAKEGGKPRTTERCEVQNAMCSLDRTGCPWRAFPHDVPPWSTVGSSFRTWRNDGTWERLQTALREQGRVSMGREPTPSAALSESHSVKTSHKGGLAVLTAGSTSKGARGRSSWIPQAGSFRSWSRRPTYRIMTVGNSCLRRSRADSPDASREGWAERASRTGGFVDRVKETLGWDVEMVEHPWSGLRGYGHRRMR